MSRARVTLKSYRVLFNRNNHGYYHATLVSSMFTTGNAISFANPALPNNYASEIPLFLDPEEKLTQANNVDMDLGVVSSTSSSVTFNIQFFNAIQRKRFDKAIFDANSSYSQQYYNKVQYNNTNLQTAFGLGVPMYIAPFSSQPDNGEAYSSSIPAGEVWALDHSLNDDGTINANTPGSSIYPSYLTWVHTGVQVGNVDPYPGGKDYDTRAVNEDERKQLDNFQKSVKYNAGNPAQNLAGSGYRRGAIIFPYAVDLVFEVSDY